MAAPFIFDGMLKLGLRRSCAIAGSQPDPSQRSRASSSIAQVEGSGTVDRLSPGARINPSNLVRSVNWLPGAPGGGVSPKFKSSSGISVSESKMPTLKSCSSNKVVFVRRKFGFIPIGKAHSAH